jgi:hypothetical protein
MWQSFSWFMIYLGICHSQVIVFFWRLRSSACLLNVYSEFIH